MLRKTAAALAVAGVIALGSATPAFADTYPVDISCTASPATVAVGQTTTITCSGLEPGPVTFTVTGPGITSAALASVAAAATSSASIDKIASAEGVASFQLTPPAPGTFVVTVADQETSATAVTLTVASGAGTGTGGSASGGGLAVTGGSVAGEVVWLGVGALGLGGIAVAAAVARRRAASVTS